MRQQRHEQDELEHGGDVDVVDLGPLKRGDYFREGSGGARSPAAR